MMIDVDLLARLVGEVAGQMANGDCRLLGAREPGGMPCMIELENRAHRSRPRRVRT